MTKKNAPRTLRPSDVAYDVEAALRGVVGLTTRVPDAALTAGVLGTLRQGHGAVIGDGLIVTVSYLVTEAQDVWITTSDGRTLPGHVIGHDQECGLALVQAMGPLDLPALTIGSAASLQTGSAVVVAGSGGRDDAIMASVVGKQEFAGYWEYLLEEAVFTAPAHPAWGGTALLGPDGALCAVGSLHLKQSEEVGDGPDINMLVPIDLLAPIRDDLLKLGRTSGPARPWIGLYATEIDERIAVIGLAERGPAHDARLAAGDIILQVAGREVRSLAEFLRTVWALGPAGTTVPLLISRDGQRFDARLRSVDRRDMLLRPRLH